MRVTAILTIILAAAFAAAAAETASSTSSADPAARTPKCQAQNIVDTCLAQFKSRFDNCGANNYECLCNESQNILTCYNNCPGSPESGTMQSQIVSYCGAYSATASIKNKITSSSSNSSVATRSGSKTSGSDSESTGTETAVNAEDTTSDSSSATKTRQSKTTSTESTNSKSASSTGGAAVMTMMPEALGIVVGLAGVMGYLM